MTITASHWHIDEFHRATLVVISDKKDIEELYCGYDDEQEYRTVRAAHPEGSHVGEEVRVAREAVHNTVMTTWYPGAVS